MSTFTKGRNEERIHFQGPSHRGVSGGKSGSSLKEREALLTPISLAQIILKSDILPLLVTHNLTPRKIIFSVLHDLSISPYTGLVISMTISRQLVIFAHPPEMG